RKIAIVLLVQHLRRDDGLDAVLVKDASQLLGTLAGSGGMRLVDNDSKAAVFSIDLYRLILLGQAVDGLRDKGKLLDSGYDDGDAVSESLCKLLGVVVDLLDHALLVFKLINRVLQLLIENQAICDNDDRIENFLIL